MVLLLNVEIISQLIFCELNSVTTCLPEWISTNNVVRYHSPKISRIGRNVSPLNLKDENGLKIFHCFQYYQCLVR